MPQRFLRPGLTTSKRWNRCDWPAQSLYLRLITLVDDYGRYDADPELIRSHAFPFGDPAGKVMQLSAIARMMETLARAPMLVLYESEGKEYLQLLRWQERPRSTSKYPEPTSEQLQTLDSKCSPPSSSPSSLAISHRQRSNGSSEPATLQDWITELGKDDTYKGINVKREFGKMTNWCRANRVNPTRRRFVNWLNRVDRPLILDKPARVNESIAPIAAEFTAWAVKQYPKQAQVIKTWKVWSEVQPGLRAEWWRETKSQLTDVLTA